MEVIDHEALLEAEWLTIDQVREATASFPLELAEAALYFASEAIKQSERLSVLTVASPRTGWLRSVDLVDHEENTEPARLYIIAFMYRWFSWVDADLQEPGRPRRRRQPRDGDSRFSSTP